jgi:hypothetical protein
VAAKAARQQCRQLSGFYDFEIASANHQGPALRLEEFQAGQLRWDYNGAPPRGRGVVFPDPPGCTAMRPGIFSSWGDAGMEIRNGTFHPSFF